MVIYCSNLLLGAPDQCKCQGHSLTREMPKISIYNPTWALQFYSMYIADSSDFVLGKIQSENDYELTSKIHKLKDLVANCKQIQGVTCIPTLSESCLKQAANCIFSKHLRTMHNAYCHSRAWHHIKRHTKY